MSRPFLVLLLIVALATVQASQKPMPYSLAVRLATEQQAPLPEHPVYIWPWVKSPGAHDFKQGMTVADLVRAAGGFAKDERLKDIPSLYIFPTTLSVYRPSAADPDPISSVFRFPLDWSKPDGGISQCKFELHEGDLVGVSM